MSATVSQKELLVELIRQSILDAKAETKLSVDAPERIGLEVPNDKSHGDFASNIALVLAKREGKPPRQVAQIIVDFLTTSDTVSKVEIAGPGFINFFLNQRWIEQVVTELVSKGLAYGDGQPEGKEKVLLEFVSANPVGPMNVVNARAAAVGDSLARIMRAAGWDVSTEYYVNDAGNQADTFALSLEARLLQQAGRDVAFPEQGYPGEYVNQLATKLLREKPELLDWSRQERLAFCKTWGTDQMVLQQQQDLMEFGVQFDHWFRERQLHQQGALEHTIAVLEQRGCLYRQDGALWFATSRFGDDKDRVLIKSDGTYTYVTADIAYHRNKLERGFSRLIDILGPDHHGYIGRMQAAVQALGYERDALEVLILQYVSLLRHGQQVKMSKRAGDFISLQDLLSEVGRDAARYFFLMRALESHLDFDMALACEQTSNNPVFYIQYAYARICSIEKQAAEAGVEREVLEKIDFSCLDGVHETELVKKIAEFPEQLARAATNREPQRVARYALDLAGLFHAFYTHCHILGEKPHVRQARLTLAVAVKMLLQKLLYLMGVSAPESM